MKHGVCNRVQNCYMHLTICFFLTEKYIETKFVNVFENPMNTVWNRSVGRFIIANIIK